MKVRLIIAGGRDFHSYGLLEYRCNLFLNELTQNRFNTDVICISGGCKGADFLGERYAIYNGYDRKQFSANWKKYGKAAGPIRNEEMARFATDYDFIKDGNVAACIAFWNNRSPGTANMIETAQKYRIQTKVILY